MTPEELGAQITQDSKVLAEQFYFFTVVIMWLIHAGFMAYEAGVARRKNVMSTALKNILTIAVVTPAFYYLGWWIYGCMERGFVPTDPDGAYMIAGSFDLLRVLQVDPRLRRQHGAEPAGQHLRRLLGRVPALLLDDGLDHVRRADRARPARRLPACSRASSAPSCGSWTPPGAGAPAAGSSRSGASTTRSPRGWSTAWRAPSRSGCCCSSGHASASTREPGRRAASCRTTSTSRCSG